MMKSIFERLTIFHFLILILTSCNNEKFTAPVFYNIEILSGNNQSTEVEKELPEEIVFKATDKNGNALEGVTFTFLLSEGSVSENNLISDLNGEVTVKWTLGRTIGEQILNVKGIQNSSPKNTFNIDVKATAEEPTSVTDIDGNTYKVVKIGNQFWMAENLKTTKYNDGSVIPNLTDANLWKSDNKGAYRWYNDDIENKKTHGALYNDYAVRTGKLAPTGWHVSTDDDFMTLEITLGFSSQEANNSGYRGKNQGADLKSLMGWPVTDIKTDKYGFNAYPSGLVQKDGSDFSYMEQYTYFWTLNNTSDNIYRRLDHDDNRIYKSETSNNYGLSVRCVRD